MNYVGMEVSVLNGAIICGRNREYVYIKLGKSKRDENSKEKHNTLLIGKLNASKDSMYPNENYFKYFNMPMPAGVAARGVERPTNMVKDNSYSTMPLGTSIAFGFGIACHSVARATGLWDILVDVFGERMGIKIITTAAYFA